MGTSRGIFDVYVVVVVCSGTCILEGVDDSSDTYVTGDFSFSALVGD